MEKTEAGMSAKDIFEIYRTRFQLEFVFRDAKQFTGLTHCQARNSNKEIFANLLLNKCPKVPIITNSKHTTSDTVVIGYLKGYS